MSRLRRHSPALALTLLTMTLVAPILGRGALFCPVQRGYPAKITQMLELGRAGGERAANRWAWAPK